MFLSEDNIKRHLEHYRTQKLRLSIIEKSFPFTSHPEAFLDLEPYELCAYGKISDVSIETNESTAVCKIRLCVECEAQKNVPALFCTDIFSTENECEIEKKDYSVPYSVFCGNISSNFYCVQEYDY